MTLIAQAIPVFLWIALYTLEYVPWPRKIMKCFIFNDTQDFFLMLSLNLSNI